MKQIIVDRNWRVDKKFIYHHCDRKCILYKLIL